MKTLNVDRMRRYVIRTTSDVATFSRDDNLEENVTRWADRMQAKHGAGARWESRLIEPGDRATVRILPPLE